MTIALAILLLSSTGSASVEIRSEESIGRLIGETAQGAVRELLGQGDGNRPAAGRIGSPEIRVVTLDSQHPARWLGSRLAEMGDPRRWGAGTTAWFRAPHTFALRFAYTYAGLRIERTDEWLPTAGRIRLTADVYGRLGPRGELDYARLTVAATSGRHGMPTVIRVLATGHTPIGDHCRIVNAVATRRIHEGLAAALARAERTARAWHAGGHAGLGEVLHATVDGLRPRGGR